MALDADDPVDATAICSGCFAPDAKIEAAHSINKTRGGRGYWRCLQGGRWRLCRPERRPRAQGKIVENWRMVDRLRLAHQLGRDVIAEIPA